MLQQRRSSSITCRLGSEAPAGESRPGFEVGKDDENAIRNNFLNCNIASPKALFQYIVIPP